MKVKSFLAALLAASAFAAPVGAEQPAANAYRAMFQSGRFYLRYSDKYTTFTLAADNGMRMKKTATKIARLMPIFGSDKKTYPDHIYRDGKYYTFASRKKATVAASEQLHDPNIDPRGGWNDVRNRLAVPEAFQPLCPRDAFRDDAKALSAPVCVGSDTRTIRGRAHDCDVYAVKIRSQTGGELAEMRYVYYYRAGALVRIDTLFCQGGEETRVARLAVAEMTDRIPNGTFQMPRGLRVYAVGLGDMDDLLEQPVEVERF